MYHIGTDLDEATQPGYQYSDKPYGAPQSHWHENQQHYVHNNQYPISAPAVPSAGDDYFSFSAVPDPQHATNNPSEIYPSLFSNQGGKEQKAPKYQVQQPANLRAAPSRIRHRSNLSHSFTNSDGYGQPHALLEPESNQQATQHSKLVAPPLKKNRNPGFRLQLDNLDAPNPLQKFHLQILASPHSDSSFEVTYDNMRIMDRDVFLQHGGNGNLDQGQENVTPLMNPPQTTENGYFGAFENFDTTNNGGGDMLGGYLTVPPEADGQDSKNSDTNSDMDNYLAFPVDDFQAMYEYPKGDNGKENAQFQGLNMSALGYYDPDNSTRADASFEPIMFNSGHEEHDYNAHPEFQHVPQHAPQNEMLSHDIHRHDLQHHNVSNLHDRNASGGQNLQIRKQRPESQGHHHALVHNHIYEQQDETRHKDQHQGLDHANHIEFRHEQPRHEPHLHEQPRHEIQRQELHHEHTHLHQLPQNVRAFQPSRPELERSVSAPSATGKVTDKKLLIKKKKTPKGVVCSICERFISRDFSRHMRIHNEVGRFQCVFPRSYCKHRSGKFNRPYDYKKHLLNMHFNFDDPSAKTLANLTEKLNVTGQCIACGQKFIAIEWLDQHILTKDLTRKCPELQRLEQVFIEESEQSTTNDHPEDTSHDDGLLVEELEDKFFVEDYDDSN